MMQSIAMFFGGCLVFAAGFIVFFAFMARQHLKSYNPFVIFGMYGLKEHHGDIYLIAPSKDGYSERKIDKMKAYYNNRDRKQKI